MSSIFSCAHQLSLSLLLAVVSAQRRSFLIGYFVLLVLTFGSSSYVLDTDLYQICIWQIFSHSLWLVMGDTLKHIDPLLPQQS